MPGLAPDSGGETLAVGGCKADSEGLRIDQKQMREEEREMSPGTNCLGRLRMKIHAASTSAFHKKVVRGLSQIGKNWVPPYSHSGRYKISAYIVENSRYSIPSLLRIRSTGYRIPSYDWSR